MFTVNDWKGRPRLIGEEHTELRWLTLGEAAQLPDLALPGDLDLLEQLRAGV
jgi:hypothetical protein